jgi:hypothetical protein
MLAFEVNRAAVAHCAESSCAFMKVKFAIGSSPDDRLSRELQGFAYEHDCYDRVARIASLVCADRNKALA